ncbi:MAG: synthase subunit [Actinomycetota bacterium]
MGLILAAAEWGGEFEGVLDPITGLFKTPIIFGEDWQVAGVSLYFNRAMLIAVTMTLIAVTLFVAAMWNPKVVPGKLQSMAELVIDFIRQNPAHLRVDPGSVEPGTVCPNPASWHRLDTSLRHMALSPTELAGRGDRIIFSVAQGFVGTEAAIAFNEFVSKYASVISAEDILDRFKKVEDRLKDQPASSVTAIIEKLADHCKDNAWSAAQAKNVGAFSETLGGELLVTLWNAVSKTGNLPNIQKLHKLVGKRVVEAVKAGRDIK